MTDSLPNEEFDAFLDAARRGESEALDRLCAEHYDEVRIRVHAALRKDLRRRRKWLGALLSTGDVVHDVFVGVLRELPAFRGTTRLQLVCFLASLTRNRLIDTLRYHEADCRTGRRIERDQPLESVENGPSPDEYAISHEEIALAYEAMQSITPRDRALLRGRIEDGERFETLAENLGFASADSARKTFYRARARLALRLRDADPAARTRRL